jgi:hypothetical protein
VNAQTIADALDGKPNGKGYRCTCPVREHSSGKTLDVIDGDNGQPVAHCHAGCDFKDVASALRAKGLWPDSTPERQAAWKQEQRRKEVEHAELVIDIAKDDKEAGRPHTEADAATVADAEQVLAVARWKPPLIDASELLNKEFPPINWAIPGLVPEGVTLLAGKPKLGKSWMALGFGIAVVTGGKALSKIDVPKGECLYLALEDNQPRLKKRLGVLLPDGTIPAGLTLCTEWRRAHEGGLEDLLLWLNDHPACRLVTIDTLAKIRAPRGARDSYEADYEVGCQLQEIAHQFNVAILVIHHLRKMDADDPMDQVSGTTGLTGGVDGSVVLTRRRGEADAVLHVTGRDIEDDTPLALNWDMQTATWLTTGHAAPDTATDDSQDVLDVVFGTAGLTARQIADKLDDSYQNVRQVINRMVKRGELEQVGGNRRDGYLYGAPDVTVVTDVMDVTGGNTTNSVVTPLETPITTITSNTTEQPEPCPHCAGEGCDWCEGE